MADFPTPNDSNFVAFRASDGTVYWKCAWDGTDSAGGTAYWPKGLQDIFSTYGVIIDKVVISGATAANEDYYFYFFQNTSTGRGSMAGPSGATVAATHFHHTHDGPYGPFIIDQTASCLAFQLYAFNAFTAGDDFSVHLAGRALSPWEKPILPTQPVSVKEMQVWPWQRG